MRRSKARSLARALVCAGALLLAGTAAACPRIVSQSPYITRALEWFGKGDCIVGVGRYDRRDLPRTGGIYDPDAEAIAALKPDLVITADWTRPEVLDKVTPPGARSLRLGGFASMADAEAMLRQLGAAVGVADADARVAGFSRDWQAAAARIQGAGRRALLLSACTGTPYSYGPGTLLHDLFSRAGFRIVETHEKVHLVPADDGIETLVDATRPELIFAFDQRTADSCSLLPIDREVRIVHLDADQFAHPGPGLIDGLESLRKEMER